MVAKDNFEDEEIPRAFPPADVAEAFGRTEAEVLADWAEGDRKTAEYDKEAEAKKKRAERRVMLKAKLAEKRSANIQRPPPIYEDEAIRLEQPEASLPPADERSAVYRVSQQARKLAKKEAQQTAIVLLALLDGIASMLLGPSAKMADYEREMIQEPLERIISRMDIVSSEIISRWSDPILVTMGLIGWLSRVIREQRSEKTTAEKQHERKEPKEPTKPDNPYNGDGKQPLPDVIIQEQLAVPHVFKEGILGKPNEY